MARILTPNQQLELDALLTRFEIAAEKSKTKDGVQMIFDDFLIKANRAFVAVEFFDGAMERRKKFDNLPSAPKVANEGELISAR